MGGEHKRKLYLEIELSGYNELSRSKAVYALLADVMRCKSIEFFSTGERYSSLRGKFYDKIKVLLPNVKELYQSRKPLKI